MTGYLYALFLILHGGELQEQATRYATSDECMTHAGTQHASAVCKRVLVVYIERGKA